PCGREAERRVIQDEAGAGTDQEQRGLPPVEGQSKVQDSCHDQGDRNRNRGADQGCAHRIKVRLEPDTTTRHYAPVKPPLRKTQPPRENTAISPTGLKPSFAPRRSEA